MNTFRYYTALLVLMALPPGLLLWFFIHPFARFWRRLGPAWTYVVLSVPTAGVMVAVFHFRARLLAVEFGTSYVLAGLAVICAAAAAVIQAKRRKHLTKSILSGIPELSRKKEGGKLLTEGIYGKIRHPRYIELMLFVLGYSFLSNYLALYVLSALSVPTLYLVIVLEEAELRERFGSEYEEYCNRVPRFVPFRNASG